MIDKETFAQIIHGIIQLGVEKYSLDDFPPPKDDALRPYYQLANEAAIYYKTAIICERDGVEDALRYYTGTHDDGEYKEFTGMTNDQKII